MLVLLYLLPPPRLNSIYDSTVFMRLLYFRMLLKAYYPFQHSFKWLSMFVYIYCIVHFVVAVTKKIRISFDNFDMDMEVLRDEMMKLFDRLAVIEVGMKARLRGQIPQTDTSGRRSLMGSRQMIYGSSSSDLRGSTYSLNRGTRG